MGCCCMDKIDIVKEWLDFATKDISDSDMQTAINDADGVMNFVLQRLRLTEDVTYDIDEKDRT
jgi:hypothetical protein